MTTRRTFIKNSIASSALISLSGAVPHFLLRASAASLPSSQDSILVVVQLTGGNDGLNTVIPYANDEYYANRFTLAVGRQRVVKLDSNVGLHPSLERLARLAEDNALAVIQGVGYPNPNRSHFESMDLWHTAHHRHDSRAPGWLGRTFGQLGTRSDVPAIHLGTETQPLALANADQPAVSIRSLDNFRLNAARNQETRGRLQRLVRQQRSDANQLLGFIQESESIALATSERLESISRQQQSTAKYPYTTLGQKLKNIATLIASGLATRIYYVSLDGFDTHSNQSEAHAGLLREFGDALAAFHDDLTAQELNQRVAVMAFSEFGRRVRENASRGTDHGTAAPMFIVSDNVRETVVGDHPSLTDLDQGDLKHQIDYRSVYAELLENWMHLPAGPIVGDEFAPHPILKSQS